MKEPKPKQIVESPGAPRLDASVVWDRILVELIGPPSPNSTPTIGVLLGLEEQNCAVPQVEIDEMLRF